MRIVKMNDRKVTFVNAAREMLGDRTVITRQEMLAVREACGLNPTWIKKLKTGHRGEYYLPTADGKIEDGAIGAPVKGATLIGSGFEVLKKVKAVDNDMELDPGIGTCGKNGQGVPVGVGQPTLLIDGLTVGGTEALEQSN